MRVTGVEIGNDDLCVLAADGVEFRSRDCIESVCLGRGLGSGAAGLAMAFKLIETVKSR